MGSPSRYVPFQSFRYKPTYDMSQILLSPYFSTDYHRPNSVYEVFTQYKVQATDFMFL